MNFLLFVSLFACSLACTNILVSPGATTDGSSFITYNADWDGMYGSMAYYKHQIWPENSTIDIYAWDDCFYPSGSKYLGTIAQVSETFTVTGNMNEYGVAIGETTFGGLQELTRQPKAIIDYGNLIYLTLQRSKSAKEAISVIDNLCQTYGYFSSGECFSISDSKEVWHMEIISKGSFELGSVWVAMKLPDGTVGAHANQARIRTFPRNDPINCLYSKDVVSFAKKHGYYPDSGSDNDFSFSDVYNPVSFLSARSDEARVWSIFRHVAGAELMDQYLDYALGKNISHRMPLFVTPKSKLSLNDTMMLMRDHFEGTPFSMEKDIGAEAFSNPIRWHPLTWSYGDHKYLNERTIATQQTAFAMVAQSRSWFPREIGGIMWFAVDDTACTVYFPMYSSSHAIPQAYAGKGNMTFADFDKAWWSFNVVANLVYTRWNIIYPDLFTRIQNYEAKFFSETAKVDAQALGIYKTSPEKAIQLLTDYSVKAGEELVKDWWNLFRLLFARYRDGDTTLEKSPGIPTFNGYPEQWRGRIVKETGDHYQIPDKAKDQKLSHPH